MKGTLEQESVAIKTQPDTRSGTRQSCRAPGSQLRLKVLALSPKLGALPSETSSCAQDRTAQLQAGAAGAVSETVHATEKVQF